MTAWRVSGTLAAMAIASSISGLLVAQAPSPAFEVTSVKVNNSARGDGQISGPTPGRFIVTNIPLRFIVLYAYDLKEHQLVGMPEWTSTARYDISATYPARATPSMQELRTMVTPDGGPAAANGAPPPDDGASIFTALREQLGLNLEPTRAPFNVLVVDRVERPTEN